MRDRRATASLRLLAVRGGIEQLRVVLRAVALPRLAEEAVKRRLVPRFGREIIRILLLHHDLKPWRGKNVVRAGAQ